MLRGRGAGDEGWAGGGGGLGARKEGWERVGGRKIGHQNPKKQTPILSFQTPPPLLHTSYPIFLTPNQSPHINNTHSPNHPIGFSQKQRLPTHKSCTQSPLHPSSIHHLTPTLTSTLLHTLKPSLSNPPFQRVKSYGNSSIQNYPIHIIPSNHLFHPHAIYFAIKIS